MISGLLPRPVVTEDGLPTPEALEAALQREDEVHPPTGLVCLENTHNMAGGRVLTVERTRDLLAVARRWGLPAHLDGARLFNAAAALGVEARELAAGFDSVSFCLSKGLGAPVGSVLCGSVPFIRRARRVRKLLGGGMRQVGVLAAAGLVALEEMRHRLVEDHAAARCLAEGLAEVPGLRPLTPPETNILILEVSAEWCRDPASSGPPAPLFVERVARRGVKVLAVAPARVRMVTHFDLPGDAVERTLEAAREEG